MAFFQVTILNESTRHRIPLSLSPTSTIKQLQEKITDRTSLAAIKQLLIYRNKPLLKLQLSLQDYGITRNSEILLRISHCDANPEVPIELSSIPPMALYYMCINSETDIETQLHCITLLMQEAMYIKNNNKMPQLITSLFDQSKIDPNRLQLIEQLSDKTGYRQQFFDIKNADVIELLNDFCDPCQHFTVLQIVNKLLHSYCKPPGSYFLSDAYSQQRKKSKLVNDAVISKLNLLLMYCGHEHIIKTVLDSYNELITEGTSANNMSKLMKYSKENADLLKIQYIGKIDADNKLFDNFMRDFEQQYNTEVAKVVVDVIGKYYHCYKDQKQKEYNLMQRIITLAGLHNGYSDDIRHKALTLIHKITRYGNDRLVAEIIYEYQLLLTLRVVLEKNYKRDYGIMNIVTGTIYNCVVTDQYCLFSYDVLVPMVKILMDKKHNEESVIYAVNIVRENIPNSKLYDLVINYTLIESVVGFMEGKQWNKDAVKTCIEILECFLEKQVMGISKVCVEKIKGINQKSNVLKHIGVVDQEVYRRLQRIIRIYFGD
eukprot:119217_1